MTKKLFCRQCAKETNLTEKQVNSVIDCYLKYIKDSLMNNDSFILTGIGKLYVSEKKIHKKPNFISPNEYLLNCKIIRLRIFKSFKEILNSSQIG